MITTTDNHRYSFAILRWMCVVTLCIYPFTLGGGFLPLPRLLIIIGLGIMILTSFILYWRYNKDIFIGLGVIIGFKMPYSFDGLPGETSISLIAQSLCIMYTTTSLPLLIAPRWFMKLAKTDHYPPPFSILRWMCVVTLCIYPFTLGWGFLPLPRLLIIIGLGIMILTSFLLYWRYNKDIFIGLGVIIGFKMPYSLDGLPGETSIPLIAQSLCIMYTTTSLPLLIAPRWFMKLAKIDHCPPPFSVKN
jgi:hypothetical protein